MKNNIKNKILIICIVFEIILVFISIALALNNKKLVIKEFPKNQKALDIERNYQNINTGAYYETLEEALETVESNQTIKVLNSKTETTEPSLASGKANVKLDMNGQTVTLNNVTLTNSGKLDIYNSSSTEGKLTGSGTRTIINAGTLTTNGTSSANRLLIENIATAPSTRIINNNSGKTLTLNTNTYISYANAIEQPTTPASRGAIRNYGILKIQGATITNIISGTTRDEGIYNLDSGRTIMTSGIINCYGCAIYSTATGTSTPAVEISGTIEGTVITSSKGIGIRNNSEGTVQINGGEIYSGGSNAVTNSLTGTINVFGGKITTIASASSAINNNSSGIINITGGTILGEIYFGINNNATGTINVTGGIISGTTGIYNKTSGIINVSGNATQIIGTTEQGIRGYIGTITVSDGAIKGKTDGIYIAAEYEEFGTATITGGTVIGEIWGVQVAGNSILTLGVKDSSVSTSNPVIQSTGTTEGNGVYIVTTSGKLNFYDGKIIARAENSIYRKETNKEDNYEVVKTIENGIEIATLRLLANPPDEPTPEEPDLNKIKEMQQAIIASADAYWRRGTNIQYEPRLKYYKSPEDATEDNIQYGTCNTFTYDVYKDALGISTPVNSIRIRNFYTKNNNKTEHFIIGIDRENYYDKTSNTYDEDAYNAEIKAGFDNGTILQAMQPGDMIAYINEIHEDDKKDHDRHVQMVYSLIYNDAGKVIDAWIIHGWTSGIPNHATEDIVSRYDSNQREGTVQKIKFSEFYYKDTTDDGVINAEINSSVYNIRNKNIYKSNYLSAFYVIRPIANGKTWVFNNEQKTNDQTYVENINITEMAKDRLKYPNIYISKTSNYNNKTVAPANSELTYIITVKNLSTEAYNGIIVTENLPEGATYISGGDKIENGVISWNSVAISAGQTKTFAYTVKTPTTVGKEIVSTGKVNNIPNTTVKNIIGYVYSNEDINSIRESVNLLKNSSSYTGFEFVNEVYKNAFQTDLGISNLKTSDILDDSNNMISLKELETLLHNDNQYDYNRRVKYYYIYEKTLELYNTARIKEINLHPGEIILTSKDDENNAYIYLGDVIIGKTTNGIITYSTENEKDQFLKDLYFADESRDENGKRIAENVYKVKNIVLSPANLTLMPLKIEFDEEYNEINKNGIKYIENIQPKTTLEEFVSEDKIKTNGAIEVIKNGEKITNSEAKISTGMTLKISLNDITIEYTIVVKGDTNGDGDSDISDIMQVNKHRLKKTQLTNEKFLAGDVNKNDIIDINDLMKINKYRLKKIDRL